MGPGHGPARVDRIAIAALLVVGLAGAPSALARVDASTTSSLPSTQAGVAAAAHDAGLAANIVYAFDDGTVALGDAAPGGAGTFTIEQGPLVEGVAAVVAADASDAWWISVSDSHWPAPGYESRLIRCAFAGGDAVEVQTIEGVPQSIAVDDDFIYWLETAFVRPDGGDRVEVRRLLRAPKPH
jgi:hypothetical protein